MAAVALSAGSDDGEEPSGSESRSPDAALTEVTIDCPGFADTAERIADAQTELYSGTGDSATIDELVSELEGLKEGAPEDVQTASTTWVRRSATRPSSSRTRRDGQTITAYITSQCG